MEQDDVVQDPRVEEVIVYASGEAYSSSKLLLGDRRAWAVLRAEHEDAHLTGQPIAVCAACHQPVKPRMSKDSRRFFWHFRKNAQCPYQGKSGPSQRILDAMRYNGQKEGAEHRRIKQLLVESLDLDGSFNGETLRIERRWWGAIDEKKWRIPDVSIVRDGVRIAFEVQLSSTYLSVMRERHKFYLENGGLLFWIFREAITTSPRQMQDDIFYWNNSNLFVIDDETARLSVDYGELVLRCHYLVPQLNSPEQWHERLIRFSELTIDRAGQKAYWYDNAAARQALEVERAKERLVELREQCVALWTRPGGGDDDTYRRDYLSLAAELTDVGVVVPAEPTTDVKRFAWLCLSAATGSGVGIGYSTLLQVANYAFDNCPELVHYFLATARRAGTTPLLLSQDEAAGAKRRRQGRSHDPWRVRIQKFRTSYQLSMNQKTGEFPISRDFEGLYNLLFPEQ